MLLFFQNKRKRKERRDDRSEWIVLLPDTNLESPEGRGDHAYAI